MFRLSLTPYISLDDRTDKLANADLLIYFLFELFFAHV